MTEDLRIIIQRYLDQQEERDAEAFARFLHERAKEIEKRCADSMADVRERLS